MPDVVPDPTQLSRLELLQLAQGLGVSDADVMTRAELRAAIDKARRPEPRPTDQHPITWVSVARRLLASVVERGLNLPDAASLIRGDTKLTTPPKAPPPVATVTLARIYGAQGHVARAIATLDEVLESDPDHEIARELRNQLEQRRIELLARDAGVAPNAKGDDPPGAAEAPVEPDLAAISAAAASSALAAEPPPFIEPPPSAQPPPFIDAQTSAEASSSFAASAPAPEAASSPRVSAPEALLPAPEAKSSPEAAASPEAEGPPEATAVSLPAKTITSVAPAAAISPDASAEQVAPTFDVVDHDEPVREAATELPAAGFYAEPPTMVSTVSLGSSAPRDPNAHREAAASLETEPPPTIAGEVELPTSPPGPEPLDSSAPPGPQPPSNLQPSASANEPAHSPNGLSNGFTLAASANGVPPAPVPPPEPSAALPHVPGLVLIETDTPIRYLYWELAASSPGAPHWIHVVSHTPTARGGTERRERRFPVHRPLGALRLEGVPPEAVVRARLTDANDTRLLVVAGAVRPRAPGAGPFEISYTPHPRARPEALATRAQPLLELASAVYWDW
jgi:hypothetical protein